MAVTCGLWNKPMGFMFLVKTQKKKWIVPISRSEGFVKRFCFVFFSISCDDIFCGHLEQKTEKRGKYSKRFLLEGHVLGGSREFGVSLHHLVDGVEHVLLRHCLAAITNRKHTRFRAHLKMNGVWKSRNQLKCCGCAVIFIFGTSAHLFLPIAIPLQWCWGRDGRGAPNEFPFRMQESWNEFRRSLCVLK